VKRRLLWTMAVLVAIAGGVALGAVRSKTPTLDEALEVTGNLTFVWHGDPARGCAAAGLCGSHGSVIVHFDGYADLTSRGHTGTVTVDSASGTARVRRDDPGSQPGECVDTISADSLGITLRRPQPGHWIAAVDASSVSGGRCAGPLARDLARLRVAARRLSTRALGFDLRGHVRYAAGPFSGEMISTLVLRPDTTQVVSTDGSTVFSPPPPRPRHRVLVEYARVRYRIAGATGALGASFAGDGQPECVAFDNCGTSGTLRLTVNGFRRAFQVAAERIVRHRVGRSAALADLRAERLQVEVRPFDLPIRSVIITEAMSRVGAGRCADRARNVAVLSVGQPFGPEPPGVQFVIGRTQGGSDEWRTHCPGPTTEDVAASNSRFGFSPFGGSLATGTLSPRKLGVSHAVVVLRQRGTFHGFGYSGTRTGAIRFTLTLLVAAAGTRVETASG
jgi:hypothetical protein